MDHEIDKLAWLLIKDNKVMMARSKGKDAFYLPGGKREAGEGDHTALIREIKEEISVDLVTDTITYVNTFYAQAHGKPQGTRLKLTCYSADFEGECKPASEIEEIQWFGYQHRDKCSAAAQLVLDKLKAQNILE